MSTDTGTETEYKKGVDKTVSPGWFKSLGKRLPRFLIPVGAAILAACAPQPPKEATSHSAPPIAPQTNEQPIEPLVESSTPKLEPTNTPQPTDTPEPKQEPTATATKEPTAIPKPPEIESPFPKYGVWEGEFSDGTQTSYMVMTTPLDEKMGAIFTYLNGLLKCSAGKMNYGSGLISLNLETFLKPGFKRGQFRDSIDPTYDPQQRSISGRLIIPPDSVCDAQNIPFKLKFVGNGPDTFTKAVIRSYEKAGLYTDATRETMVKERLAKYVGELPPQASR
ncbi:hypothetical protein HY386_02020 [Candidatus Daviesbacteria bacterium]|nr:hypothetical protein [Candidatus Daviesbacteria bacterium]